MHKLIATRAFLRPNFYVSFEPSRAETSCYASANGEETDW